MFIFWIFLFAVQPQFMFIILLGIGGNEALNAALAVIIGYLITFIITGLFFAIFLFCYPPI